MRIVAVLPILYLRRLEAALPGELALANCATLADCQALCRASSVDCVILDPLLLDDKENRELLSIVRSHRAPVVFYTTLTSVAIGRVLPALAEGAAEIVLANIEDGPQRLRKVLLSLPSVSLGASLVSAVARDLPALEPIVRQGLVAILLDPLLVSSKDLHRYTTIGRRTIERELSRAHLAPLHRWFSVSRLARSFTALSDGHPTHTQAARIAGYATARSLDQQYRKILHVPLAEAQHRLSPRQFVAIAARALYEP